MATTTTERAPEVHSVTEQYPELGQTGRPYVPARRLNTDYPVYTSSHLPSTTHTYTKRH